METYFKRILYVLLALLLMIGIMPVGMAEEREKLEEIDKGDILEIAPEGNSRGVSPGETLALKAYTPADEPTEATWSLDNEEIGKIDKETGVLTGLKEGVVVVKAVASFEGETLEGTCTILVNKNFFRIGDVTGSHRYFETLTEAIESAEDNSIVEIIKPYKLSESISINKNIELKSAVLDPGDNSPITVLRTDPKAYIEVANGGNLTLSSFMINGNKEALVQEESVTILRIKSGGKVTMNLNGSIYGVAVGEGPGAILNEGSLTIKRAIIAGCVTPDNGGAIYNVGTLLFEGGFIESNMAENGGGIYNTGEIRINEGSEGITSINSNSANNIGGGIYNEKGKITLKNGDIGRNTARKGGGIYQNGRLILENDPNHSISINSNRAENVTLPQGKVIELSETEINKNAMIMISSEDMTTDKTVDVIRQQEGQGITSYAPFYPDEPIYSIEPKPGDPSILQLTGHGKIFLGPDGDDKNDGTSVSKAVKSLERAVEIGKERRWFYTCVLPENENGETANLSSVADFSGLSTEIKSCNEKGEFIEYPEPGNRITRISETAGIQVGNGDQPGILEISNVIIDGNDLISVSPMIFFGTEEEESQLVLNDGTIIKNALSKEDCSGIYISGNNHVVIKGGSVINCKATGENSVGGIRNEGRKESLDFQWGNVMGCSGTLAGGIYQNSNSEGATGMRFADKGIIKVTENSILSGEISNLYLAKGELVYLSAEELYEGSSIGITSEVLPEIAAPVKVAVGPMDEENQPVVISLNGFIADSLKDKINYLDETQNSIALELKKEYTITASAGEKGSINPMGKITVLEGNNQSFTITPEMGYEISEVKIDGKTVGVKNSYTFENIADNHSIQASFKAKAKPVDPVDPVKPSDPSKQNNQNNPQTGIEGQDSFLLVTVILGLLLILLLLFKKKGGKKVGK